MTGINNNKISIDSELWDLMNKENELLNEKLNLLKLINVFQDDLALCNKKIKRVEDKKKEREDFLIKNNIPIMELTKK